VPAEENLFCLAKACNEREDKPRIYMGIGTEDKLYDSNVRLKQAFETYDYDFTYRESPGAHNWAFWDEYIQYVLKWLMQPEK
jgi:putative lysine transport system ATP-binding protein